jgi:hypothetical protein
LKNGRHVRVSHVLANFASGGRMYLHLDWFRPEVVLRELELEYVVNRVA